MRHYVQMRELLVKHCDRIWHLEQIDTFFPVTEGWLKIREQPGSDPVLISYKRSTSSTDTRPSEFFLEKVNAVGMKELLSHVLSPIRVLKKNREFFMYMNTKVHLDQVVSIGPCLELETIVSPGLPEAEAKLQCQDVVRMLGLGNLKPVTVPYVDLLEPWFAPKST